MNIFEFETIIFFFFSLYGENFLLNLLYFLHHINRQLYEDFTTYAFENNWNMAIDIVNLEQEGMNYL